MESVEGGLDDLVEGRGRRVAGVVRPGPLTCRHCHRLPAGREGAGEQRRAPGLAEIAAEAVGGTQQAACRGPVAVGVDDEGRIIGQENHLDPRDVTNPGLERPDRLTIWWPEPSSTLRSPL